MAVAVRTIRHGTMRLKDGAANVLVMLKVDGGVGDADVYNRGVQPILERGTIAEFIYTDDEPLAVSFALQFVEFYGEGASAVLKPYEFIANDKNNASVTLTKVDATMEVWNFDIELTMVNPTGAGTEVITWKSCVASNIKFSEGYSNKLSFSIVAKSKTIASTISS